MNCVHNLGNLKKKERQKKNSSVIKSNKNSSTDNSKPVFKRCDHLRKSFEQREMMMIVVSSLKSIEALAGDAILRYSSINY